MMNKTWLTILLTVILIAAIPAGWMPVSAQTLQSHAVNDTATEASQKYLHLTGRATTSNNKRPELVSGEAPEGPNTITRTENSSSTITYAGSWSNRAVTEASQGSTHRSGTAGNSLSFTFSGEWLGVGFMGGPSSGKAEIFLDSVSQGVVDLYRNGSYPVSLYYNNLPNASHTISIVVQADHNPFSSDYFVLLDYFDAWDGSTLPDGLFEQDSARVFLSNGWGTVNNPAASGGSYVSALLATAWFPFTGDSVTFHSIAFPSGGSVAISLDGQPVTNLELYNNIPITRTLSLTGLGAGAHVLQASTYRGNGTLDAFSSPGVAPFYTPPSIGSYHRYEEDDPALIYNGFPFTVANSSWDMLSSTGIPEASASSAAHSDQAGDTASLNFDGRWVGVGFHKYQYGGQAEVFLDGISQGIVGLYSPQNDVLALQFGNLAPGTHTISVTVLGQPDPPSAQANVRLDYFESWDGQALPDDVANANLVIPNEQVSLGGLLTQVDDPNALSGDYVMTSNNTNIWYAFTGDSFIFYPFSRQLSPAEVEVYVDESLVEMVDFTYPFTKQPLTFHYAGFGDGIHIARVKKISNLQVDGFRSNPVTTNGLRPLAEWWDDTLAGASLWGGLHVPVAVGDVNNDGSVEIVIASSDINNNGTLALYHGDGGAAGNGNPILWSHPYNIFNGFEDVGAPAIAELDGLPGAEIIHPTGTGLYVYHADGSTYWYTDTFTSHAFFATPAIGNLDLDPEPEIVVNMDHDLVVFDADGELAWRLTLTEGVGMPVLADLTGDGWLDILFNESGTDKLHLYDFGQGAPTLAWTATISTSLGIYGSPAIADIDGLQPGGDNGPEIAITSDGWLHVVDANGDLLHATPLDPGSPGGVSVADLDGDGEVELVTTMYWSGGGKIYAVNPDGSVLWSAPALDNSPLSVSLMDLDGDGAYEVAWNGAVDGLTLFNGSDGSILFNEPHPDVISKTGSDYPVFADVDQDGSGELVVASQKGVRVFGFGSLWGPTRPLWNQHTYHITNINDDLGIPSPEANSWEELNTFRAQISLYSQSSMQVVYLPVILR